MEIPKIKELCHSQSLYYYDYVKRYSEHNGKTIEKVHSISFQEGSSPLLFEIKLEKPIFDFEKTYYKNNLTNEYYFNKRDILIKEYDEKNRLLYIQILREDVNLKELNGDDFFVVTDLLFLINNLIEWYDKNGLELNFSSQIPCILKPKIDICIDTILNENQIDAVNAIFQNSYSYIWGPPGTGKTKAVLSTSVINYIFENKKILEIGCGIGRWAEVFHDKCDSYLGIDYSEDLIEIAKENYNYDNCHFQVLSASQLDTADLLVNAPFDIVIITGVLIYFNDDTIKKMIKDLNSLCASNKTIYIRETLSFLETRLTLKDFFSENLEADYNAIYRTDDEFLDFINGINGNITIETDEIFDELKNFTETGYKYFLIKSVN